MKLINITRTGTKTINLNNGGVLKVYEELHTFENGEDVVTSHQYNGELFDATGDYMTEVTLSPKLFSGVLRSDIRTTSYSNLSPEDALALAEEFMQHAKIYKEVTEKFAGKTYKEIYHAAPQQKNKHYGLV